jgi:phage terminase large subunit
MARHRVQVQFKFRPHQLAAYERETRFECRVWHRRAGKTFYTVARQLGRALATSRNDHRAYYLAPTRVQAKRIAWDYLRRWALAIEAKANESELRVDLANGSRIQLLGAEQYDDLRGLYADDITLDEAALIPSAAWSQVLSPMLADRQGRATFTGTPKGRMNLLYEIWEQAGLAVQEGDAEWGRSRLSYQDTGILLPGEVARMRRTMTEAEFRQELECSWDAALRGSYFGAELARADEEGRITSVKYDARYPVIAALDLGMRDAMPVIYAQEAGSELRLIGHETFEGTSLPDLVDHWHRKPWRIETVIVPHDIKVRELGTGMTREEILIRRGCRVRVAPNIGRDEGISQVVHALRNIWFDREATRALREALGAYRSEYDEVRQVHRLTPVHDWSSHHADAMRYLVVGRGISSTSWGDNSRAYRGLVT